jgi:hypothetical protein
MDGYLLKLKFNLAMLKSVIKYFCLLSFFVSNYSCENVLNKKKNCDLKSNEFVKKEFDNYSNEYKVINDSILIYTDSILKSFLTEYYAIWKVDSMICINSKKNKLVATINISIGECEECKTDDVIKILGKKINGVWYFFKGGGNLTVPRNYYGKDEMHPLTFHELSQIGRKNFLESALIKNAAGEYVVNDKWIDAHFYDNGYALPGWDEIKDKAKYDSVHWYIILHKWKEKIDTNEYKPLHRKVQPKPAV